MKEAFRKNKNILYQDLEQRGARILLSIIFVGRETIEYKETEEKIIILLQRLIEDYEKGAR